MLHHSRLAWCAEDMGAVVRALLWPRRGASGGGGAQAPQPAAGLPAGLGGGPGLPGGMFGGMMGGSPADVRVCVSVLSACMPWHRSRGVGEGDLEVLAGHSGQCGRRVGTFRLACPDGKHG
jgi:hypothetical protein